MSGLLSPFCPNSVVIVAPIWRLTSVANWKNHMNTCNFIINKMRNLHCVTSITRYNEGGGGEEGVEAE